MKLIGNKTLKQALRITLNATTGDKESKKFVYEHYLELVDAIEEIASSPEEWEIESDFQKLISNNIKN